MERLCLGVENLKFLAKSPNIEAIAIDISSWPAAAIAVVGPETFAVACTSDSRIPAKS